MCGIAGVLDLSSPLGSPGLRRIVERLCALQHHRGPDAAGIWEDPYGRCVLGHRRLAIIDLDARSNQPMVDGGGRYVVVFNGEIYNFRDLKKALGAAGVRFRTESDTEVLVEGYARWGHEVFTRLDGMFALAIYDTEKGELVLARDRVGEKPLYVAWADGLITFASEFKPLLTVPGLSRTVSEASLYEFFVLRYVASPNTLYESISSVQPGTFLRVRPDGNWSEHSYFAFDVPAERPPVREEDYIDALESALVDAVKTRLLADVPVGAFLSSGIDSGLVCGIAATLASELRCFSAGFAGDANSETAFARRVAEAYGLPFEDYLVSETDLLVEAGKFGAILDEPNGDRSCLPTFFLSRLVRTQVKVAVSGDGGDELFGGYGRYAALRGALAKRERPVDGVLSYLARGLPVFPLDSLRGAFPGQEAVFRRRFASRFLSAFARSDLDDIERMRLVDLHSYLPGAVLAKVDRMSMRNSLEVRTPFFSPGLLELSSRLPMTLCERDGNLKVALRRLLERYLPTSLIRPIKQGFGMPVSFFQAHAGVFSHLADDADEALAEWEPLKDRGAAFSVLRQAARDNINSLWAWITLGQWSASLPV
ncbi:MAG TPA: asparagine synthase (glutamine-hydrolyzing) [Methylococcus sp.]|nr:asparagine synthase (glutamine-hydrolyzing) [Methylococcus sp.]